MNLIRCFVAADLPAEVRTDFAALAGRLRSREVDLRWVAPGSLHLTLKFLGEISPEVFARVSRALDDPLGVPAPIRLKLAGVGAFPSVRRARVVWVGLGGDVAALAKAALTIEARAEGAGIPREGRPFAPHLTLGRSRGPAGASNLESALQEEIDFEGSVFEVRSFVLYESQLRPGGPIYTLRRTISLE